MATSWFHIPKIWSSALGGFIWMLWLHKVEPVRNNDTTRWVARSISNASCGGEFELRSSPSGIKMEKCDGRVSWLTNCRHGIGLDGAWGNKSGVRSIPGAAEGSVGGNCEPLIIKLPFRLSVSDLFCILVIVLGFESIDQWICVIYFDIPSHVPY